MEPCSPASMECCANKSIIVYNVKIISLCSNLLYIARHLSTSVGHLQVYRFYSERIKALVISAVCCVMWLVLYLHSIFVLVAVFVLGLIF
jgi:hypothetical protein